MVFKRLPFSSDGHRQIEVRANVCMPWHEMQAVGAKMTCERGAFRTPTYSFF